MYLWVLSLASEARAKLRIFNLRRGGVIGGVVGTEQPMCLAVWPPSCIDRHCRNKDTKRSKKRRGEGGVGRSSFPHRSKAYTGVNTVLTTPRLEHWPGEGAIYPSRKQLVVPKERNNGSEEHAQPWSFERSKTTMVRGRPQP